MSRISLTAYKLNKAAAPERRLGFGESASTREARAQESQLESQLLDRLEGLLKKCGHDPANSQAIRDWFCVHGLKGHAEKGLIRVLVYIRVWSAVLRGEGVHVQGQDIDAAENLARQAFGACLCAVNAVNGAVYKLAGSERKEKSSSHSELVMTITDVLPRLLEAMTGPGEKSRPRGFHPNELAKLRRMVGSWRKRSVLNPPVLHDLENLLAAFDVVANATKENGDASAEDAAALTAGTTRHKKHIAWTLKMEENPTDAPRNNAGPAPRPVAGVGMSSPGSGGQAGAVSPPGLGTELERKLSMESALRELFAVNIKTVGEWWGAAFEGRGVFREGPEGHWSIHLRRAREEAHRRRKQGRGLLGVDGRHGDRTHDDMERAVAEGDRRVAAKHERRHPKPGRDAAVRTTGITPGAGGAGGRSVGKDAGRSSASAKADTTAEDSDALMEVDEPEPSDNDSMPSTPSTVPSEASPSPEPEPVSPPPAAALPESATAQDDMDATKNVKRPESGDESKSESRGEDTTKNKDAEKHTEKDTENDIENDTEKNTENDTENNMEKNTEGGHSDNAKRPVSPPPIILTEKEKEEAERQRRREDLRRAGKERGKLREAEKQRLKKEKDRQRQRMIEEHKRKKAESDKILKEARERAAELLKQEEQRAREQERRESERQKDGSRRDRDKGRDDRARGGKETERVDASDKEQGRHVHPDAGESREKSLGGKDHVERGGSFDERARDGERDRDPARRPGQPMLADESRRLNASRERKLEKSERKRRRSDPGEALEVDRGRVEKSRRGADYDSEYNRDQRPRKKKSKKDKKDKKDSRHDDSRHGEESLVLKCGSGRGASEGEESRGRKRSRDSGRTDTVDYAKLVSDDRGIGSRRARSRDPYRPSAEAEQSGTSGGGTERRDVGRQGSGTLARDDSETSRRVAIPSVREDRRLSSSRGTGASVSSRHRSSSPSRGSLRGAGGGHERNVDREGEKARDKDTRERNAAVAVSSPRKAASGAGGGGAGSGLPGMDAYGSGCSSGRAVSEDRSAVTDSQGKRRRREGRDERRAGLDVYGPNVGSNLDVAESRNSRRRDGERDSGSRHPQRLGSSPGRHGLSLGLEIYGPTKEGEDRGSSTGQGAERGGSTRSSGEGVRESSRRRVDAESNIRPSSSSALRGRGRSADRPQPLTRDGQTRWRPSSPHGSFGSKDAEWGRSIRGSDGVSSLSGMPGRVTGGSGSGGRFPPPPGMAIGGLGMGMPAYDHMGLVGGALPPLGIHSGGAMGDGGRDRHNMADRDERRRRGERTDRGDRGDPSDRGDVLSCRRRSEDRWRGSTGGGRDEHGRRGNGRGGSGRSPQRDTTPVDPPPEEEPEEGELVIETTRGPVTTQVTSSRQSRWGDAADSTSDATGDVGCRPARDQVRARSKTREVPTVPENGNGSAGGDPEEEEGEIGPARPANTSGAVGEANDGTTVEADERMSSNKPGAVRESGHSQDRHGSERKAERKRDGDESAEGVKLSPTSSSFRAENGTDKEKLKTRFRRAESPGVGAGTPSGEKAASSQRKLPSHVEPEPSATNAETVITGDESIIMDAIRTAKEGPEKRKPSHRSSSLTSSARDDSRSTRVSPGTTPTAGEVHVGDAANIGQREGSARDEKQRRRQKLQLAEKNEPASGVSRSSKEEWTSKSKISSENEVSSSKRSAVEKRSPAGSESEGERRGHSRSTKSGDKGARARPCDRGPKHTSDGETAKKGNKEPEATDSDDQSPPAAEAEGPRRRSAAVDRSGLYSFVRKSQRRQTGAVTAPAENATGQSSPSCRIVVPSKGVCPTRDSPSGTGTPPATTSPHGNVYSRLGPLPGQTGGSTASEGSIGKNGRGPKGGGTPGGGVGGGGDVSGIVTWGPHRKRDRGAKEEKAVRPGGLIGRVFHDHLKTPRKSAGEGGSGGDGGGGAEGAGGS